MYLNIFIYGCLGAGEKQDADIADYFYDILYFYAGSFPVRHVAADCGNGKRKYA